MSRAGAQRIGGCRQRFALCYVGQGSGGGRWGEGWEDGYKGINPLLMLRLAGAGYGLGAVTPLTMGGRCDPQTVTDVERARRIVNVLLLRLCPGTPSFCRANQRAAGGRRDVDAVVMLLRGSVCPAAATAWTTGSGTEPSVRTQERTPRARWRRRRSPLSDSVTVVAGVQSHRRRVAAHSDSVSSPSGTEAFKANPAISRHSDAVNSISATNANPAQRPHSALFSPIAQH